MPVADLTQRWLDKHLDPSPGRVLIAGSKINPGRPLMRDRYSGRALTGVDMQEGEGVDLVANLEDPQPKLARKFGHVDCCSVLEHSKYPWLMAQTLVQCLRRGGSILVSVPFVWRRHGYPNDYWRMTADAIPLIFPAIDWRRIDYVSDAVSHKTVPATEVNAHPYLARCEVLAFGRLRDVREVSTD